MPQMKECVHCNYDFELDSTAKRNAGGKINECPDCVEELGTETAVKYLGLTSGEGKMATLSIVAFESAEDREAYGKAWQAATDPYQSNPRSMSEVSGSLGSVKMRHISLNAGNPNHKGQN
jgi:NAD-dependent SIR2 family protein deacetylase|tara:strand:- start:120 stop:479 length:360 start_codon:yes stop_codon:yes gene_type:complete